VRSHVEIEGVGDNTLEHRAGHEADQLRAARRDARSRGEPADGADDAMERGCLRVGKVTRDLHVAVAEWDAEYAERS
jgi:hypothetical protein